MHVHQYWQSDRAWTSNLKFFPIHRALTNYERRSIFIAWFLTMTRLVLIHTVLLRAESAVPRGGGSALASRLSSRNSIGRPFKRVLTLPKDRHDSAIKAAAAAYWSGGADDSEPLMRFDAILVETHKRTPPSTWSLPDFADEFQNEIKVTRGAAHGGNDATRFTPEECQEV
jgi:hypothetical protein